MLGSAPGAPGHGTTLARRARASRAVSLATALAVALLGAVVVAPAAQAAGTPDVQFALSSPAQVLRGTDIAVTLTATNPTGPSGYNASFRLVLPAGATLSSYTPSDATTTAYPQVDGSTVVVWSNVTDLLTGTSSSVVATVSPGSLPLGPLSFTGGAYVNTDPRLIPTFSGTGTPSGQFTGSGTGTSTTVLAPFAVTKATGNVGEGELMRGVHQNRAAVTLRIDNNAVVASNGFDLVDYVPASLEFLGCGTVDNSTTGEEYAGSGALNASPFSLPGGTVCPTPTSVDTVTVDPDAAGPLPLAVYTRVHWDTAALASVGIGTIGASGSRTIAYAVGIPQHANTMTFVGGTPTAASGLQGSNLDNNSGTSTQETATEIGATNLVGLTGVYSGNGQTYSDADTSTVTLEDLAIQKGAGTSAIAQGAVTTWTLNVEVSEYTSTASNLVVVDTVPDGLRVDATNPAATSVVEQSDGSTRITWSGAQMPDLSTNGTRTLTVTTTTRQYYREGFADDTDNPVRANDTWTNTVTIEGDVVESPESPTPGPRHVVDDSSASQSAAPIALKKEVAKPVGTCGDGSLLTWQSPASSTLFGPGDVVCWRIAITTPVGLDTANLSLTDFLPAGFAYGSATTAAGSAFAFPVPTVTGQSVTWAFPTTTGRLTAASTAAVVLSSTITDPAAGQPGDLKGNLAKLAYTNTPGAIFQLRTQADAPWKEPLVALTKSAAPTTGLNGGETVTYTITLRNTGNQDAVAVAVRDLLPAQLSCADLDAGSLATAGLTCTAGSPDRLDGTVASLAAGATVTLTYTATVPSIVGPAEVLTNHAGVRQFDVTTDIGGTFTYVPANNIDPTQPAPNAPAADATATVTVQDAGVVKTRSTSVTESGNALLNAATIGEWVTYTVTATLPANTTLHGATLSDPVPAGLLVDLAAPNAPAATINGAPDAVAVSGQNLTVTLADPYVVGASDETVVLTFRAQVRNVAGNVAGTVLNNVATLGWTDSLGTAHTAANPATSAQVIVVEPRITLAKTESDADNLASPGELIGFTVTAGNAAGASTAHDVVVVDTIPTSMTPTDGAGVVLAASGPLPGGGLWDATARTITWNSTTTPALASVAAGATVPLPYSVRVADPVPSPTSFTNTVVATTSSLLGTDPDERGPGGTSPTRYTANAAVTLAGPRPSVTKSVDRPTATIGEVVTYTVVATIPAGVTTFDATVRDTLPAGMAYVDTLSAVCTTPASGCGIPEAPQAAITTLTPSGPSLGWFLGDIQTASAADRQITLVYRARVADVVQAVAGARLTNSATIASNLTNSLGSPTAVSDLTSFSATSTPATADVDVVEPHLVLTKTVASGAAQTHARRVIPGETVTYTITLSNTGTSTAYDVAVADTTDPRFAPITTVTGATVTDADPVGDGSLAFTVANIAAGATATITYQAVVPDPLTANPAGAELTNVAVATSSSLTGTPPGERSYTSNTDTVGLEADLASIGDTVWFDTNGDGIQGPGELGVAGVTVTVTYLGPDGVLGGGDDEVHTTTTDSAGSYLVTHLPQGAYQVSISGVPAGTVTTFDENSGTTAPDGVTTLTLADADAHLTADFGIRGSGTVGDTVWLDQDGDGVKDPGEPGLGGVQVTVSWPATAGQPAGSVTTTTAADGTYSVTGIPATTVTVTLTPSTYPSGTSLASEPHGGTVDGTATFALAAGATDNGFDFGLQGTGEIGDRLWVDTNRDGVQDPTEPGIPGATVVVRWLGPDGNPGTADDLVVTTTTGADGAYLVDGLPAGPYTVTVTALPTALAPTYDEDNGIVAPNSATVLTLPAGGSHLTADFGFVAETGVGDRVWLDTNGDGVQDPGEPGIPGVVITVTSAGVDGVLGTADDIVRTTTTAADGSWLVTGLPAGLTRVAVTGGLPGGISPTFDSDGTGTPGVSLVTLVNNVTDLDQDFGHVGANSIGDRVWVDVNANGVQDAGEPGLVGVAVQVTWLGPDGVIGGGDDMVLATVTDATGHYLVDGLPSGAYAVQVGTGVPAGYRASVDETGAADGSSSVAGLGASGPEAHLSADFGYTGTGAIGGTVWLERVVDGTLDTPVEAGLPGIAITVTWGGPDGVLGTPDDVVILTVTGPGGTWAVEHMPPGPFTAVVDRTTIPAGTEVVWDRTNGATGPTGAYSGTLLPGEVRTGIDTAVRGTGSIGDLIWVDTNRDGMRAPTEPVAPHVRVVVTWLGADGVLGGGNDVSIEVLSNDNGYYVADGLPAGQYLVTFDRTTFPKKTAAFADLDGGDPLVTSVSLTTGQVRTDVDLVLRPTSLAATGAAAGGIALLALLLLGGGLVLRRRAGVLAARVE